MPLRPKMSDQLRSLLDSVDHIKPIKKDTFLFSEGEIADELYIIKSGRIQIGKLSPDGRELSLRICNKDDIVGELSLYSENVKYILNAKIMEDGEVAVIKKSELEEELINNSGLAIEFMKIMNEYYRRDQTRFRDLVLHGKKGALYSTLIRLSNSYGKKLENGDIFIDIILTNQQLANFGGTSRESVNRMLNELKRNNILSTKKGNIIIHDLQHLRDEINCENCPVVLCSIH
ncbi:Crp/Fnr family transcriptional regulator [Virgibacillus oceani]|uniref:Crp/Fnr family transcriptional regulator n=1 Tax=Virgibacillus oceani TaxID=1479511 RepID=A0A917HDN8_9BACI|nr:Crp/Fnr family transcriptional regulator [Virgibacillus oceani]GGG75623.1 Crp/Fnr family transcriptional regulator [Virgibacillus oceani]